jgi:hypothetical protein
MGKTLKNLLYAGAFVTAASVFSGCQKDNSPPEAILDVNPISGEAPLNVRMKVTGKDLDGNEDIKQYKLYINTEVVKSNTPIDITRTFENEGAIQVYGEVTDSENQSDKTNTSSIQVSKGPFIQQSVGLANDVNINYSATLSKVDKAELKVNKGGNQVFTQEIKDNGNGTDYEKTFTYSSDGFTKGDYEFVLKSDNLEKKDLVSVPNYKPTANFNGISTNVIEGHEISLTLPTPSDKNPEDNKNISYTYVKSIDGKTQVILNGTNLKIKALENYTGNYQVEVEYGSSDGGLEKKTLQGEIIDNPKKVVNPFVQPNDSTLNWYGSGDTNNDNTRNSQDLTRMNEIISGTFSNPSDTRLYDRADIDGNGIVNAADLDILNKRLNGVRLYLPGEWNLLMTLPEREDWLSKMLAIDNTSEISPPPGYTCEEYSYQTYINFHGVALKDISKFTNAYPYDLTNNGRFNIPLYFAAVPYFNSSGTQTGGHAMNVIFTGFSTSWEDQCNVEPQFDHMNVQIGQDYLDGINSRFYITGPPVLAAEDENGKKYVGLTNYIVYSIKENILSLYSTNPDIDLITKRGK